MKITIEADVAAIQAALNSYSDEAPTIMRGMLSYLGGKMLPVARKGYRSLLSKQSGRLYRGIVKQMGRGGKSVSVYSPTSRNAQGRERYGFILAAGATILPKSGDYLTIKTRSGWRKVKSVNIAARDWIEGPLTRYIESSDMASDTDKYLQKQIDKIDRRT